MTLPLSYSRLRASPAVPLGASPGKPARSSTTALASRRRRASPPSSPQVPTRRPSARFARSGHSTLPSAACHERAALSGESSGGEGRIRTFEAAGATDLQSVAFDRFATSPKLYRLPSPRPAATTFRRLRHSRQKPLQLSQPPSAWNERSSARRVTVKRGSLLGAGEGI